MDKQKLMVIANDLNVQFYKLQIAHNFVEHKGLFTIHEYVRISELGIPIRRLLSNILGIDETEVVDKIRDGKISFTNFDYAIEMFYKELTSI